MNKPIKERIITKENDILICARNGSQRLIGKNAIIKKEDANNTFGAFMMVYRSKDNPFILPLLSTKRYFSQVGENLGARINQITTSDFNGFDFYFPNSHAERAKIAELFRLIDERIATQNKIIEKLETLIKGICNKSLYTVNGTAIQLGDILIERRERTVINNQYEVLSSTVKGIFSQREYFSKDIASENNVGYKIIRLHDVVLSPQNLWMG
ncbi:type I restriction-modification system, S subunit domain protein, partial [Bacteroides fragilis str. 2-F-2 